MQHNWPNMMPRCASDGTLMSEPHNHICVLQVDHKNFIISSGLISARTISRNIIDRCATIVALSITQRIIDNA